MPRMEGITQPKLLLVEGRDVSGFFAALFKHSKISNVQIQDFGGVKELKPFLGVLTNASGFESVQSVGIVRDAEQNASAAFESVRNALKSASLDGPDQVGEITEGKPRTGIYLLPDLGANSGMLEDLCLNMLETDAAMPCVEQYFQCLSSQGIQPPDNFAKAKITTFLASKPKLKQRVGYAMNQDYWDWDHPCLDPLKEFLKAL